MTATQAGLYSRIQNKHDWEMHLIQRNSDYLISLCASHCDYKQQ